MAFCSSAVGRSSRMSRWLSVLCASARRSPARARRLRARPGEREGTRVLGGSRSADDRGRRGVRGAAPVDHASSPRLGADGASANSRSRRPKAGAQLRRRTRGGPQSPGRDGAPRHVGVPAVPRTRHQAGDALPVRRPAGPVARAGPEGPRLLTAGAGGGLRLNPRRVRRPTAPLGRPGCAAGVAAVELAAATPAAGLGTEASSRPGTAAARPDVEPDAQPAKRGRRRVGRQVDIQADVARANPFRPPPPGPVATRR